MTKWDVKATLEWDRIGGISLAGDPDDNQVGAADPNASAAVVTTDDCSTVAWQVVIDGIPISVSVKACTTDQPRAVAAASAVAKQLQAAVSQRADAARAAGAGGAAAVLSALIPPQAAAAVKAARTVVKLFRSGRLRSAFSRLRGGARVIGASLLKAG